MREEVKRDHIVNEDEDDKKEERGGDDISHYADNDTIAADGGSNATISAALGSHTADVAAGGE